MFARYDAPRPVELFATLLGSYRATMDSIVRLRLGTHVDGLAGVDDLFAYPSIDVAPGRGIMPSLSLGYAVSYHFASASISEPFGSTGSGARPWIRRGKEAGQKAHRERSTEMMRKV